MGGGTPPCDSSSIPHSPPRANTFCPKSDFFFDRLFPSSLVFIIPPLRRLFRPSSQHSPTKGALPPAGDCKRETRRQKPRPVFAQPLLAYCQGQRPPSTHGGRGTAGAAGEPPCPPHRGLPSKRGCSPLPADSQAGQRQRAPSRPEVLPPQKRDQMSKAPARLRAAAPGLLPRAVSPLHPQRKGDRRSGWRAPLSAPPGSPVEKRLLPPTCRRPSRAAPKSAVSLRSPATAKEDQMAKALARLRAAAPDLLPRAASPLHPQRKGDRRSGWRAPLSAPPGSPVEKRLLPPTCRRPSRAAPKSAVSPKSLDAAKEPAPQTSGVGSLKGISPLFAAVFSPLSGRD